MDEPNVVFAKADAQGRIVSVNSNEFIEDLTGWIEIDSGYGDRYLHAQRNYFRQPIYTDDGIPRYKLIDGVPVERTAEEIAADAAALPERQAGEADYIMALEELGVDFSE